MTMTYSAGLAQPALVIAGVLLIAANLRAPILDSDEPEPALDGAQIKKSAP